MADRYWVGGSGIWNTSNTANWSATFGGAGGASVPTSIDNAILPGPATVTVSGSVVCQDLSVGGGTTLAGTTTPIIQSYGLFDVSSATAGTGFSTIGCQLLGSGVSNICATGGKTIGTITVNRPSGGVTLGDALTSSGVLTIVQGTFTTNNYNVTATQLSSSNGNTRAINLGSSTITLSSGINFLTSSGLTLNAGTSQIICSSSAPTFAGGGQTFYVVAFTNTAQSSITITGANTFTNNLTIVGRTTAGINSVSIAADQIFNGTLTLSAGTNATMRTFIQSNTIGTTRTLTVNSFAAGSADIDFRDITVAGAAAPISGTRFGDCKGNSGITFDAPKTVYWNLANGGSGWADIGWATTGGGTPAVNNFPLAQDISIFQSTGLNSAATISIKASYNIGTIDMSARTTNTMTLATGTTTPAIYSNWINGTGTTLSGTGALTFAGRSSQTITSAGKTFTQLLTFNSPGGSVTLQDALTTSSSSGVTHSAGELNANGYNVTISGTVSIFTCSSGSTRTLALGSGVWTFAGVTWDTSNAVGLIVTGTGTISLTKSTAKTFAGGGIQTYPTLNQGGTGALTITGSNKFANITNTAIGSVLFTGGTTNEFGDFNLNGTSTAARLTLGSTNTTQAILKKPSTWYMGAGSLDNGNNTGLNFSAGGGIDYLAVSYINGQTTGAPPTYNAFGNFFMLF